MSRIALNPPDADVCRDLVRQLQALRAEIVGVTRWRQAGDDPLAALPAASRASAENLLHYLSLRCLDLRGLQEQLARLGLSSLGRAEPHVLATIDAVLYNLALLLGEEPSVPDPSGPSGIYAAFDACAERPQENSVRLLGDKPAKRRGYIMVTLPTEAAHDYLLVHALLDSGMDCVRINCAHDNPDSWAGMIRNLRYAERTAGRKCRILMDLGGPKLRTGPMQRVPGVLKVRPRRARDGRVLRPARIWLTSAAAVGRDYGAADATVAVDPLWLAGVRAGDRIGFEDGRGAARTWRVLETTPEGCWVEARKTAYLVNGTVLGLKRLGEAPEAQTSVDSLPPQEAVIAVRSGDVLLLDRDDAPGAPALHDTDGQLLRPGRVSLPIAEIYHDACPGEPVYFDDGRVAGIIERVEDGQLQLRVTRTRNPVENLGGDKGVNFPDTRLDLPALSAKDLEDLEFAARHADMVGLSFTNSPADVRMLREHLQRLGGDQVGVVVKIETKRGFANLPQIILEAMRFPACGVMIARGDLAVETGFERLAEVQEEILWVCEAAHVPVIWATQVLETLTKTGQATRAEITDAAMGQAAECVMLNKGPHIQQAVRVLDDILQRMQGHRAKKRSMLRKLELAVLFRGATDPAR
ncbi:MAG: pyruvate kinase [Lysobacterales bacterium]|nr:MAG: pyruvate kinase [Xanthomonadales bacterium]